MYNELIEMFVKQQDEKDEAIFLRDIQEALKVTDAELIDLVDDAIASVVIELVSIKKDANDE